MPSIFTRLWRSTPHLKQTSQRETKPFMTFWHGVIKKCLCMERPGGRNKFVILLVFLSFHLSSTRYCSPNLLFFYHKKTRPFSDRNGINFLIALGHSKPFKKSWLIYFSEKTVLGSSWQIHTNSKLVTKEEWEAEKKHIFSLFFSSEDMA